MTVHAHSQAKDAFGEIGAFGIIFAAVEKCLFFDVQCPFFPKLTAIGVFPDFEFFGAVLRFKKCLDYVGPWPPR